ncbi:MAG: hypothetical protein NC085_14730, partial [Muribaculaceae bacterium]|nr:hypothetical protein [Muribaculaceae bacterium]
MKRIIALMAAIMIVAKFVVLGVSAVAAPVVAGSIVVLLTTLLLAAGHTQTELDGMSVTDMQSILGDDLNSGLIDSSIIVVDPVTQQEMTVLDYYLSTVNDVNQTQSDAAVIIGNELKDFLTKAMVGADYYWEPTPTADLEGHGVLAVCYDPYYKGYFYYYADYIQFTDDVNFHIVGTGKRVNYDGSVSGFWGLSTSLNTAATWSFYGDVRYPDGTQAPTDDAYEYVLGEAGGTKVTVDMLNPDGTVTIDGVTYNPADYLDTDALTEEGKKELVYNITNAITNSYVISDDKPIVDDKDITVDVAEEFQDYAVPVGIANVFPFCIPWDIVRGFRLLSRPAVSPKFEIPF